MNPEQLVALLLIMADLRVTIAQQDERIAALTAELASLREKDTP